MLFPKILGQRVEKHSTLYSRRHVMRKVTRGMTVLLSVVFLVAGVAMVTPLGSESEARGDIPKPTKWQYIGKIVCGLFDGEPLIDGFYRTAINVLNLSRYEDVAVEAVISTTFPNDEMVSEPSPFTLSSLGAFLIDCETVLVGGFNAQIDAPREGFVIITSDEELEVIAVYTVLPLTFEVGISIDVVRVPGRKIRPGRPEE